MTETAIAPQGLNYWLERFSQREMPVLGHTVRQLCAMSEDDNASALDLSGVVLQDAAMTSGVLKIANSAYYNPAGHEISTISRAVILLGFNAVRSIGLSLAVIDTLLRPGARERVLELMRQAVYAAVQAKTIAQYCGDPAPEEIFIATLLYRLGDMAFWSFADDEEASALTGINQLGEADARRLEVQVLGCSLRQLTLALAREWNLSGTLIEALQVPPGRAAGRTRRVSLGHELEAAVRRHGWDSAETNKVVGKVATHAKVQPEKAKEIITSSKRELEKAADAFGVKLDLESGAAEAPSQPIPVRQPDPLLQLKVLRELSLVLQRKPNLQQVLDMIMEGIFRGIGMDRVLLAVLSPDRKELRAKYALGEQQDLLKEAFHLDLQTPDAALIQKVLTSRRPWWIENANKQLTPALRARMAPELLIGPLTVHKRDIGLIYADRRPSGRRLDSESFESFRHFVDQANLALAHIMRDK